MQTQKLKKLEFPNVPIKFPGHFPKGHINSVKGWNFSRQELAEAARDGRMLTMDLDMTGDLRCSLGCRHCFNPILKLLKKRGELLSDDEVKKVVLDAKALGLKSIKIIGPGEPLEEMSLLPFLDFLAGHSIQPLIFTKATALGNDLMARRMHGMDSRHLARKLKEDYDVSILLGATSFHAETEARIVKRGWFPGVRHLAFERLIDAGFNDFIPGQPTKLALIFNPIMHLNADEAFDVYTWARVRHIYSISSPTMVAGSCREKNSYKAMTPDEKKLIQIYVKINLWAIKRGLFSIDDLERDGVSAYAGASPCQQVGAGLFIKRNGLALRCPGDDVSIQGRVREKSLAEIWRESDNLNRYGGMINVGCPPKYGKSIPEGFFEKVLDEIKRQLFHQ